MNGGLPHSRSAPFGTTIRHRGRLMSTGAALTQTLKFQVRAAGSQPRSTTPAALFDSGLCGGGGQPEPETIGETPRRINP